MKSHFPSEVSSVTFQSFLNSCTSVCIYCICHLPYMNLGCYLTFYTCPSLNLTLSFMSRKQSGTKTIMVDWRHLWSTCYVYKTATPTFPRQSACPPSAAAPMQRVHCYRALHTSLGCSDKPVFLNLDAASLSISTQTRRPSSDHFSIPV